MRIVICSPLPSIAETIALAAGIAAIDVELQPSLQEFGSALYRNPDAVGVLWSIGPSGAAEHCARFRLAEVRNVILVLLEQGVSPARDAVDRASILMAGGDDAQPWPIDPLELIHRLWALHRRLQIKAAGEVKLVGDAVFHPETGRVHSFYGDISLTKQEATVLETLTARPGLCVTKAMCMLALYDGRDEAQSKIVDVVVHKLRRKLTPICGGLDVIETVWGQGYRFMRQGFQPVVTDVRKRAPA